MLKEFDPYRLYPRAAEVGGDLQMELTSLSLSDIDPTPFYQIRPLDPAHLEELEREIRAFGGIFQPLLVTAHPTGRYGYVLLDGHHRYEVLKKLAEEDPRRYDAVPAVFLWSSNPNAAYALAAASVLSNLRAQSLEREDLPLYALRYLARLYQDTSGAAFLKELSALVSLPEAEIARIPEALAVSPVDPAPPELEPPFAEPGFRAVLYALEALYGEADWKEVVRQIRPAVWVLEAFPGEAASVLGLPGREYEEDLLALIRALGEGRLAREDLARFEGVREAARAARSGAGASRPRPPAPERPSPAPGRTFTLVVPPFEPKPRAAKRAIRDLGKTLSQAARLLDAKRLRDPELLAMAAEVHRTVAAFVERVAAPLEEKAAGAEPPPAPKSGEGGEDPLAALGPAERRDLVREIAEEEGFTYE